VAPPAPRLNEHEIEPSPRARHVPCDISPMEILRYETIKYGNAKVQSANLLGTTEAFATVHDVYVEQGRFLLADRREPRRAVAVIGQEIARRSSPS
jgi:hypothetical protein